MKLFILHIEGQDQLFLLNPDDKTPKVGDIFTLPDMDYTAMAVTSILDGHGYDITLAVANELLLADRGDNVTRRISVSTKSNMTLSSGVKAFDVISLSIEKSNQRPFHTILTKSESRKLANLLLLLAAQGRI